MSEMTAKRGSVHGDRGGRGNTAQCCGERSRSLCNRGDDPDRIGIVADGSDSGVSSLPHDRTRDVYLRSVLEGARGGHAFVRPWKQVEVRVAEVDCQKSEIEDRDVDVRARHEAELCAYFGAS